MMAFIIMTLSFTVAILLSGVISIALLTNPTIMKLYMKRVNKMTALMFNNFDSDEEEL